MEFTGNVHAEIGTVDITGTDSQLTVSGDDTSVQAGSLTVKPEDGEKGGKVSVTGGTLKVNGTTALTGSELEITNGAAQLVGTSVSNSAITVSGGSMSAGAVTMTNNSSMNITGGHVEFNNWTATGGSTTIGGSVSGIASLADGDALTVTGTATLNDHDLTIENGQTVTHGALNANEGTTITVNGKLNVTNNAVLDGSTLTGTGTTTVGGNLTAQNTSTVTVNNELTVNGNAAINQGSTLTVSGTTNLGSLTASDSKVDVNSDKALTVTGDTLLNNSNLTSNGKTELKDLTSTGSSKVKVNGGSFKAESVNTVQFYADGGSKVTLNSGKMSGDVNAADNDSSALRVVGNETVADVSNVTFTGGEVAADDGATLNLKGGTVDVGNGWFSTDGGTITTDGTEIKSGVWATKGNVTVNGGSISGDVAATGEHSSIKIENVQNSTIGDVYATQQVMNDGKWEDDGNTSGGTVTFTNSTITASSIKTDGKSKVSIEGGAQVTAHSLIAKGSSTVSVTGSEGTTNSHLLIDGNATFSDESTLSMDSAANADVTGTLTFDGNAKMELTGNNTAMTFAAGSKLYANNSKAPAITVKEGANLHFAAGSAAYTKAIKSEEGENHFTVATVAKGETEDSITFDSGASLYVRDAKIGEDYTYDLSNAIVIGDEGTGWETDNVYGDNIFEKLVIGESNQAYFEKNSMQDSLKELLPTAAVYDAAWADTGTDAAAFVEAVAQTHGEDADVEAARIAKALNAHSGMTGLAGVGYGTYRFTTAFTDHVANHEAGGLWASYLHDKSSVDGLSVGNLRADYDLTYDGAVIGSDFYNNGRTTIGAAFAYADGDVSTKSGVSTKNDVDYYGGMIYGSVKGGAGMTYRAEIGYNRSSNDLTQWNTGERITGSVDADAFHVGVAAEKEIRTGSSVWTPFLGLQYIDLSIDDYSDSLGFRHEGDSAGLWNMPVGVNYKYEVANGAWTYAPTVTLGYRFAFGDDSVDETLRYGSGAGSFGTEIAEDSFFTRIGFEAKKDNIGFGVHYGYERGSDTEANQWGINCSFFF